jgi:HD-like signal output (HDOD) protein
MGLIKPVINPSAEKSTSKLFRPPAFAALKDDELVAIYNIAPVKKLAEGAALAAADTQKCCYAILSGSVRLVSPASTSTKPLATLAAGEWFGQLETPKAWPYTVIAETPCTLMQISPAAMQQLPAKVQAAISASLANSMHELCRVLAEDAQAVTQKLDALTDHTHTFVESRIALTKSFVGPYLNEIPKLPPYATDLAMKLLDERTTPQEVAEDIKRDPSLAALVLQTVNSPYYGLRTKILDYYRALLLLGFNNIHRLVLAKSLQGLMPDTEEFHAIHQHSYVVSLFAHEIAMLSGRINAPMAGTLGLLHDLGKGAVLLLKQRHKELVGSLALVDPSAVGANLLANWQIPAGIVSVIEQQSWSAFVPPEHLPKEHRPAIATLYLAHGCCDLLAENTIETTPQIFTGEYLAELGLPRSSTKEFYREKVFPAIVKNQKCLPEPIRKMLAIGNANGDIEQTAE